jgi:hypothetical protein
MGLRRGLMVIDEPRNKPRPDRPRFTLGEVMATPNALRTIPQTELLAALAGHHLTNDPSAYWRRNSDIADLK